MVKIMIQNKVVQNNISYFLFFVFEDTMDDVPPMNSSKLFSLFLLPGYLPSNCTTLNFLLQPA